MLTTMDLYDAFHVNQLSGGEKQTTGTTYAEDQKQPDGMKGIAMHSASNATDFQMVINQDILKV